LELKVCKFILFGTEVWSEYQSASYLTSGPIWHSICLLSQQFLRKRLILTCLREQMRVFWPA